MLNIYVANLGKYNEGKLVGAWMELPKTMYEIEQLLMDQVGINQEYEEWAIHDYETDIQGISINEYDNIYKLNELAAELEELQDCDREVIEAMLSEGYTFNDAMEKKDDCIVYCDCNDMEDVAREYAEQTGLLSYIPENLQNYFDFESFGRDMSFEGQYIFTDNGNCIQIL
jgi:antirestriction protein